MSLVQRSDGRYIPPSANAGHRIMSTGFEITATPSVTGPPCLLVDCLECGQDHEWTVDDIYSVEP